MAKNKSNLLVVDWDFFFPRPPENTGEALWLYDWGHAESLLFISMLWPGRAATFLANDLPLPMVNDEWRDWWSRFKFSPDAKLYVGESNCYAINEEIADRVTGEVWLYDAHHDCGYDAKLAKAAYESGRWTCEEWMLFYARMLGTKNLHHRYPTHRPRAFEEEPEPYRKTLDRQFYDPTEETPTFDTVFVCRSGAWVPTWCDSDFEQFVGKAVTAGLDTKRIGTWPERSYDHEAALREVEVIKALAEGRLPNGELLAPLVRSEA